MPTHTGIGQIVFIIGNSNYGWINARLPDGGTWYCSRSNIGTVGLSGHDPIVGVVFREVTILSGGTRVYDATWAMRIS